MAKRTTLYLDEELLARARQYVPERQLSSYVNELIARNLAERERAALEEELRAGYIATASERQRLNADWDGLDGEEWPGKASPDAARSTGSSSTPNDRHESTGGHSS